MAGLTQEQINNLAKGYRDQRDSLPGPRLISAGVSQALREIEALDQQAQGGDVLARFATLALARRAVGLNPLKQ